MKDPTSKLTRMRLDLEEYDFTVEFLRGKNNYVADALSRITINDLKTINNEKILRVETRSSKLNQNEKINEKCQQTNNNKKPKIYEVINYNDVKRLPTLKMTSDHCSLKHGKKVIDKIPIKD